MGADVGVRPAVRAAGHHLAHEVGHEVVTEAIALLDGHPGFTGGRVDGEARAIAHAGHHGLAASTVGVELEHGRAQRIGIHGDVVRRADGDVEGAAVGREGDVAGPVAGRPVGQVGDLRGGRGGLLVAGRVGELHDLIGGGHIQGALREREAERLLEAGGELAALALVDGAVLVGVAEHPDRPGARVHHEDVAVGGLGEVARTLEAARGEQRGGEALRQRQRRALGSRNQLGRVRMRVGRCREIGGGELVGARRGWTLRRQRDGEREAAAGHHDETRQAREGHERAP